MSNSDEAYLDYMKAVASEKIPHYDTYLGDEEGNEISEVIRSNWISEGKKTREFEDKFRKYAGTKFAFAMANCTGGLMISLRAIGVKRDDEVIVPSFTHMGSVSCISLVGAKPIFVDVDPVSYTINPEEIEESITEKTKAVIAVHIYGHPADMKSVMDIANKNNLSVIEDCAQGLGSRYDGIHVGNFGRTGGFSFFADKTITTGEGGMLVTNDPSITDEILMLKNDGRIERGVYVSDRVGYNMRITEMQSAMALPQMRRLNELVQKKRNLVSIYKKHLEGTNGLEFPSWKQNCYVNPHRVNILVDDPESLIGHLQKNNMGARRFYYPVHKYPTYKTGQKLPTTEYAFEHGVSLPSAPLLEERTIEKICLVVKEFIKSRTS